MCVLKSWTAIFIVKNDGARAVGSPQLYSWPSSPQSRKGRKETVFLFGGERPPNKKACPSQDKQS
jgi:hypothetical protein